MKRTLRLLLPLTLLAAVMWPGCYTVLMHPTDDDGYRASQVSDCTRCHPDYGQYPYGHYYSPYPDYWWSYPRYGDYYANPWWWSYYDYPAGNDEGGGMSSGEDEADRGTKFDRREAPAPPYVIPGGGFNHRPGELNYPTDIGSGGGGVVGSERPQPGTGDTTTTKPDSGTKTDEGKTVRQTTKERPTPKSDATVKPADTKTEEPAKEEPKKDEGKKKSRDGGKH
jgi:hypothetical protein